MENLTVCEFTNCLKHITCVQQNKIITEIKKKCNQEAPIQGLVHIRNYSMTSEMCWMSLSKYLSGEECGRQGMRCYYLS